MSALSLKASHADTHVRAEPIVRVSMRDAAVLPLVRPLELSVVSTRADFDALEADWNDLFARAGRPTQMFQTFGWLWHWANHFLTPEPDRGPRLAIVTGRRDGRLVIACPFMVAREHGMTRLSFMGDPVSQYGDIVVEPGPDAQADIRAAWDHIIAHDRVQLVSLRKVRADAAIAPLLHEIGSIVTNPQVAPFLNFEGETDFAKFEQRYSSGARRNRRRQLRRLQDKGETAFVRLTAGPEASAAISETMALKRIWLKEKGLVSAAIADKRTEAFFRDCAADTVRDSGVRVALVRSAGETAAIEVTVACKDRVAIHVIAYDLAYEKTGAGALLMEDSIRRACESGLGTFDLLAPGGSYKFDWADRAVDVADHAVGLSPIGRIYAGLILKRLRPTAKYVIEHLPMALRRQLSTVFSTALVIAA